MSESDSKFPGGLKVLSEKDKAKADEIAAAVAKTLEGFAGPEGDLDKAVFGSMMIAMSTMVAWLIDTGFPDPALKVHALNLFTQSVVEKLGIEFVTLPNEVKP